MQILIAFSVAVVLNLTVLLFLQKRHDPALSRTIVLVYLGTITLRYLLAVYIWVNHTDPGFAAQFWGDSEAYDGFGAAVADAWSHGTTSTDWMATVEGKANRGFIYFVAMLYYVFGRNTLLVQLINGVIGALTPIIIFEIGLLVYGRKVATLAMIFTAFFPQMIFWSSGLYKDPTVMLCIAVNMLAALRMNRRFRLSMLLVYLATAGALLWLRFYIAYVVVASTVAGLLIGQGRRLLAALATQIALVGGLLLILLFTPAGQEALNQQRFFDLEELQRSRADLASANSGYAPNADVSTPGGALRVLPIGVLYLLFSPFPWSVSSIRQLLALPDVLVWYAMLPYLIRGLRSAVSHRIGQTMPILVFTTALTIAYGLFQGNVGAAYRQRTQIMMFYFLFVADGINHRRTRMEEELTTKFVTQP